MHGEGTGGGGGGEGGGVGAAEPDARLEQLRSNMEVAQRMGDAGAAGMWRRQLEKGEAEASRRRRDRETLERAIGAPPEGEGEGGD